MVYNGLRIEHSARHLTHLACYVAVLKIEEDVLIKAAYLPEKLCSDCEEASGCVFNIKRL